MNIPFRQYIFPHGIPREVLFDSHSRDLTEKARALLDRGFRFEVECKPETQVVFMDIQTASGDLVSSRMVRNGPDVVKAVESLIMEAWNVAQSN